MPLKLIELCKKKKNYNNNILNKDRIFAGFLMDL